MPFVSNSKIASRILAFLVVVIWSLAYVLTKYATLAFTPSELGAMRYLFGSMVLILVLLIKRVPLPHLKDIPWFILSGLSGFGLYAFATNHGISYVSAATASVINATTPVITAALASKILKEKLNRLSWLALLIEFIGVVLITVVDGVFTLNFNILWLILAAICTACYNLLQRPLRNSGYTSLSITAYSMFVGLIFLLPFLPKGLTEFVSASLTQKVNLIFLGTFTSAGAYMIWSYAIAISSKVTDVTNFMFLIPLFTSFLGILIISEYPTTVTIIGCVVILIGIIIFNYSNSLSNKGK